MMDLEKMQDFFFWCMVVNTVVYTITAVSVIVLRDFVCGIQRKIFGLDDEAICISTLRYLAGYKLLITVFNFTPWVVLLIIR